MVTRHSLYMYTPPTHIYIYVHYKYCVYIYIYIYINPMDSGLSLEVIQLAQKFPAFLVHEGTLPCFQELATCLRSEPRESIPHPNRISILL